MTSPHALSCQDVEELAGLFALGALEAGEAEQVRVHLETHPEVHAQCLQVVEAGLSLAMAADAVDPPTELRSKVLDAIRTAPTQHGAAADVGVPLSREQRFAQMAPPAPKPAEIARPPWWHRFARRRSTSGLAFAAVVMMLIVVGAWGIVVQREADLADHRLALLRDAMTARSQPDTVVLDLTGTDAAAGARGVAVLPAGGLGYLVLTGLPAPADDRVWQAWYLTDEAPESAGLLDLGRDGLAILEGISTLPGTRGMALTLEPAGGSEAPTTTPLVSGSSQAA